MTDDLQPSSSQGHVQAELEGHYYRNWLRVQFVGEIESRYRRYCARQDRRYLRNLLNIVIIFYVSYAYFDWYLLQDHIVPVWILRFGVGVPVLLISAFWIRRSKVETNLDNVVVTNLVWLTITTLLMVTLVPVKVMELYLSSVMIIVMAGMTITRLRFWSAVTTGLLCLLTEIVLLPGGHIDTQYAVYFIVLSTGVIMVSIMAQYTTDRARRREFLQKIIIHRKNLQLRKLNVYLRDLAELDSLTGIANRRYFDVVLDEELRRARRREYNVALLMCDIDYFKAYNDKLGHVEGDTCIRAVAQLIKEQVRRPGDLVARYGGEEFAVILPALDVNEAHTIAEFICKRVAEEKIPHPGSKVADFVTISIGVAALVPCDDSSQKQLINQADEALYRAKNRGRNQVQIYAAEASNSSESS